MKIKQFTSATLSILCISAIMCGSAAAAETMSHQIIQQTAEDYVAAFTEFPPGADVDIQANALDKRLSLTQCELPLMASAPANNGSGRHITVKISCPVSGGWTLYVPVQTRIRYPVVISRAALAPETLLEPSQLTTELRDAHSLRGNHFSDPSELIGARLIRRVGAEQPIRSNNICQVCSGDLVTILARSSALELKTSGEAIGNGTVGETIRVKNSRSQRIIDARVVAVGTVEVRL
ncbi:flagellar basal body P-ring formation chaperone FlgA [Ferrimonas pelagia]|uniref:Flagella basal body P-ring formation protein FlgA n=1 Tax=Ferrimonas pelagia TaxID=1177826 RepID=A0ABP9F8L6_9GAMM